MAVLVLLAGVLLAASAGCPDQEELDDCRCKCMNDTLYFCVQQRLIEIPDCIADDAMWMYAANS